MTANNLKTSVIVSYLAAGISTVVSLLYTPFMLRMLGQSEYGVYQLVCSIASYLSLLSFGFGSSYIRFYSRYASKDDHKIPALNGMFLTVFGCLSLVCLIVGLTLTVHIDRFFDKFNAAELHTAKILLFFLTVNVAITFINSVFDSFIIAHEKFLFQKTVYLIKTVANPLISVPFLLLGLKSVSLVVITTLCTLAGLLVNVYFCTKVLDMHIECKHFDFGLLKEIAVFSSFIFLNVVTDQINWNLDKFLLGIYRGAVETAIYGVAAQLNTYYISCSTIISNVFIPRVHGFIAAGKERETGALFIKIGRIQFMVLGLICSGFLFFGRDFIRLWVGENYADSYLPTVILFISATVALIQNIGIEIQRAMNLHKFRSVLYVGIAVVNMAISILLVPRFGVLGCTVGTALSLIIGNGVVMNIYYSKKVKLNIALFWRKIAKIFFAMLPALALGTMYSRFVGYVSLPVYLLGIAVYTGVYGISMYFLAFTKEEKQAVKKIQQKVTGAFL